MTDPERDDLLSRLDENVKHIRETNTEIKTWQNEHDAKDDKRFNQVFAEQSYSKGYRTAIWAMGGLLVAALGAIATVWTEFMQHVHSGR